MIINQNFSFRDFCNNLSSEQAGAIVAYAMGLKAFHSIQVFRTSITIAFNLGEVGTFTSSAEILESLKALGSLDPLPCPCGCGIMLVLAPCLRQREETQQLTNEEKLLANSNNVIGAIKLVRARLGVGLKEAKDIVDIYRGL